MDQVRAGRSWGAGGGGEKLGWDGGEVCNAYRERGWIISEGQCESCKHGSGIILFTL